MGVMKRLAASPSARQMVRMVADLEVREERKSIAREAREERAAIRWEAAQSLLAPPEPEPAPAAVDITPAWAGETPERAAAGFYKLGRNFYHLGQGPYPTFGIRPEPLPPAKHQLTLF